jgi:hypothetical protein
LPALLPLQISPFSFCTRDAQNARPAVLDVQPDFIHERRSQRRMLRPTKERQLKEGIGERCLDLRRKHARGHARGARREVRALEYGYPRASQAQVIGDRAADDSAANDDDL